jgi:hypothetical protein
VFHVKPNLVANLQNFAIINRVTTYLENNQQHFGCRYPANSAGGTAGHQFARLDAIIVSNGIELTCWGEVAF